MASKREYPFYVAAIIAFAIPFLGNLAADMRAGDSVVLALIEATMYGCMGLVGIGTNKLIKWQIEHK